MRGRRENEVVSCFKDKNYGIRKTLTPKKLLGVDKLKSFEAKSKYILNFIFFNVV